MSRGLVVFPMLDFGGKWFTRNHIGVIFFDIYNVRQSTMLIFIQYIKTLISVKQIFLSGQRNFTSNKVVENAGC